MVVVMMSSFGFTFIAAFIVGEEEGEFDAPPLEYIEGVLILLDI